MVWQRKRVTGWLRLAAAMAAVAALVALLQAVSPRLPGTAGAVFRRNLAEQVEASALLYTESGDVRDYLDAERGRYRTRTGP
jgi:hypothetical protein